MRNWKRWAILAGAGIVLLAVAYVIFNFVFLDFFVNLWWFDSMNLEGYYILRLFYRYLVFSCVLLFFFLIFFSNFWIASRYLGYSLGKEEVCAPDDIACQRRHRRLLKMFQSGSLKVYTPISAILAIPIAAKFYERWEDGLLFFFGPSAGISDPAYGKDIGYYLFSYPIYLFIQNRLLIALILLFLALGLLYFVENRMISQEGEDRSLPNGAKTHLSIIGAAIVLLVAWGFLLKRIELLYTHAHVPQFVGPGFIEMYLRLPLIWISLFTFLATAVCGFLYVYKRKGLKVGLVFAGLFLMAMAVQNTNFLFDTVDTYFVQPNEVIREKPFIEKNIQATLDAFQLRDVETRDYGITEDFQFTPDSEILTHLRNVPVWDRELLDEVYTQLQGIRPYYSFPNVDVDRYDVNGQYQQVYLSARELNLERLPVGARNWINRRLQYTHGYGLAMTPAAMGGDEPITWFIRDIPLASDYGFTVKQAGIYFGEEDYEYVIVPNDIGEIDHPMDEEHAIVNYSGHGGVPISSFLRKILFSVYFGDRNIFFTTKTNDRSRILFRQNIRSSILAITPFFLLDNDPYLVVSEKGLFWIQDAYTSSNMYPYAQSYGKNGSKRFFEDFEGEEFNYIRNSVKIVLDAYNGDIHYYISDPTDPIVRAYQRIYPGLLEPIENMPADIRKHVRYPKQFFTVQMSIFARYHQKNPEVFYREEDTWEFAKLTNGFMRPYYMTLNLLNPDDPEFLMLSPMAPVGRDNLRAMPVVGCDPNNYGKMVVYSFPRGQQVFGPSQISALINQDTEIAQELTLWDQAGSEVKFGRMIVLPVAKTIIYIQPVYLRSSTRLKIPELKRVMVSAGDMVVMDRTLEEALGKLDDKYRNRMDRIQRRLRIPITDGNDEIPAEALPATPAAE